MLNHCFNSQIDNEKALFAKNSPKSEVEKVIVEIMAKTNSNLFTIIRGSKVFLTSGLTCRDLCMRYCSELGLEVVKDAIIAMLHIMQPFVDDNYTMLMNNARTLCCLVIKNNQIVKFVYT